MQRRLVRERRSGSVTDGSMGDSSTNESSDTGNDSDSNKKLAAVETSAKETMQEEDKITTVAKECVSQAVAENAAEMEKIMNQGISLHGMKDIKQYLKIVESAVPKAFFTQPSSAGLEKVESNIVSLPNARKGLRQMVDICIAIVDLFCTCKIDMFTGGAVGITYWIQVAMSKFFAIERRFACNQDTNEQVCLRITGYHNCVRYTSEGEELTADVDTKVLQQLCQDADLDDVTSFRTEFEKMFVNPEQPYELHKTDYRNELKAMMLVVSIIMINVDGMSSNEDRDLKLVVCEFLNDEYFFETGQSMAMILFGNAKSEVSSRNV